MATAESPQTDPPKKKKSLFKRTVPRKKPTEPISESPELVGTEKSQDEPNDLDFFKQSKDVFPMVLQEVSEERPPSPEKHDRKRRKVSVEPESATPPLRKRTPAMSGSSGARRKSSSIRLESDSDTDIIMDVKGKGKGRSKKVPTARMLFSKPSKGSIGQIGDDDDKDDGHNDRKVAVSPVQQGQNDMTPGRRTRQSTRLSNRDSSPVEVIDEDIKLKEIDPDLSDLEEIPPPEQDDQLDDEFSEWIRKAQEREAVENPNAVISVLITSRIKGTAGLVVKRRLKQNLQAALNVWVDRQRALNFFIPTEQASKLFLTWKGHKIYGECTPAALGAKVTEHGELLGVREEGYKMNALHLEAWTEEEYGEFKRYQDREKAILMGDDEDELEAELEAQNQPPSAKKKGIKVVLKTKEFDTFNTTVHDDTTVEMLISVFRQQRGVGPERGIEIWLDGERLEDETLVKDADIDPDEQNQLEVHIK